MTATNDPQRKSFARLVGRAIREERAVAAITQLTLAQRAHIPTMKISRYENGANLPDTLTMYRMIQVLPGLMRVFREKIPTMPTILESE